MIATTFSFLFSSLPVSIFMPEDISAGNEHHTVSTVNVGPLFAARQTSQCSQCAEVSNSITSGVRLLIPNFLDLL